MRINPSTIAVLCGIGLLTVGRVAEGLNLNGYWFTSEFGTVRVYHDQEYVRIVIPPGFSGICPAGGRRDWYLAGYLEGNTLRGTMWRCTDPDLVTRCGHAATYKTDFVGTVALRQERTAFGTYTGREIGSIDIKYTMEIWNKTDCNILRKEERESFAFQYRETPAPTPPPTPPPRPSSRLPDCGWTQDTDGWMRCVLWNWDVVDWPTAGSSSQ